MLLRATNFHSPTSAIDGSREGKDVENVGDRGTDPVNRIVHLKMSWKQRLENETGKEGVELFSVFVDPRVFLWATSSFWNGGLIHRWHIYSRTDTSKFSLVEIEWCRSEGWDFLFFLTFAYARINDSFFWGGEFIFRRSAGIIGSKVNRFLFRGKLILVTLIVIYY